MNQGYYQLKDIVDPENILWENVGVPFRGSLYRWIGFIFASIIFMAISLSGVYFITETEVTWMQYVKSHCQGGDTYSQSDAYFDFIKDNAEQKGVMHCYCSNKLATQGRDSLSAFFIDYRRHCEDWYSAYTHQYF